MKRLPAGGILPQVYKSISPRSGPTCWLWEVEQAAPALALLDPWFLREISGAWMRSDIHRGWAINYLTGAHARYHLLGERLCAVHDRLRVPALHAGHGVAGLPGGRGHRGRAPAALRGQLEGASPGRLPGGLRRREEPPGVRADLSARRGVAERGQRVDGPAARGDPGRPTDRRRSARRSNGRRPRFPPTSWAGCYRTTEPSPACTRTGGCSRWPTVTISPSSRPPWMRILPSAARERMIDFFLSKLMTPSWMRALADDDPAASLNFRTDHSAAGAYTSWPAQCMRALGRAALQGDPAAGWASGIPAAASPAWPARVRTARAPSTAGRGACWKAARPARRPTTPRTTRNGSTRPGVRSCGRSSRPFLA